MGNKVFGTLKKPDAGAKVAFVRMDVGGAVNFKPDGLTDDGASVGGVLFVGLVGLEVKTGAGYCRYIVRLLTLHFFIK